MIVLHKYCAPRTEESTWTGTPNGLPGLLSLKLSYILNGVKVNYAIYYFCSKLYSKKYFGKIA